MVAPVGMHRVLFRPHRLDAIVSASHGFAVTGLFLLGVALTGVGVVIFDTVVTSLTAEAAGPLGTH